MIIYQILVLADIHGNINAITKLLLILQRKKIEVDLILIAGDLPVTTPISLMARYIITHGNFSKNKYTKWVYKGRGKQHFVIKQIESTKKVLSLLDKIKAPIVYVPGNVDSYEVQRLIQNWSASEVHYLEGKTIQLGSLRILGCGGSEFTPNRYLKPLCPMEFYRDDFLSRLNPLFKIRKKIESSSIDILITHESPVFRIMSSYGYLSRGSVTISKLIDRLKPKISIFGHYHEFPIIKKSKNTVYINPGPLTCYYFSLIRIEHNQYNFSLKKLNPKILDFKNLIYSNRLKPSKLKPNFEFLQIKTLK